MITERTTGNDLLHEVFSDFENSVKKKIKVERDKLRAPYLKRKVDIKEIIYSKFYYQSPKYNRWYVSSGMIGKYDKPKAINHYHCVTNTGPNGSKMYIVLRGNKSAIKAGGKGGYVVSVSSHVLTRMRERNPEAFSDIKENDELVEKIFSWEENGVYYDFDWTKIKKKESTEVDYQNLESATIEKPDWMTNEKDLDKNNIPVILKTLAGLFLGFVNQDRSSVVLKTYISEDSIEDEVEKEVIQNFLIHAWVFYNPALFGEDKVKEENEYFKEYMKGKENRNVYILSI